MNGPTRTSQLRPRPVIMYSIFGVTLVTFLWTLKIYAIPHHTGYHGSQPSAACNESSTQFHLSDPPYDNYFFSDCHTSVQVVVTSPLPSSNLSIIGPRLLVRLPVIGFPSDSVGGLAWRQQRHCWF